MDKKVGSNPLDGNAVVRRILSLGVRPHAETLAPIAADGDVAVVVFEPEHAVIEVLQHMGWDGRSAVLRISGDASERWAADCARRGDAVTAQWLRRRSHGVSRIFLFAHHGTLLLNCDAEGYSLEPGSSEVKTPS
jgi:hypothetical protein